MPAQTQYLFNQRYRIREESLGDSDRAIYSANDTIDDAEVTIKEISVPLKKVTTIAHQDAIRQNFAKHAKMLADLEHQSLVRVRNFFSDVGQHYLVMEESEGTGLTAFLSSGENWPGLGTVLVWMDQVLDAVNYLHNQSPAINRNCIEPRNLLLAANGTVKLSAIGISDDQNGIISTETCLRVDSPQLLNYKPLEEIWKHLDAASKKVIASRFSDDFEAEANSPSDVRSDIYSVAAAFYHILTGHLPFDALERAIDLLDGKPDPLTPPNVHKTTIPVEISDALTKALSIRRDDRFSTPSFMRQVLKTAVARIRERGEAEILGDEPHVAANLAGNELEAAAAGRLLDDRRIVNPVTDSIPASLVEPIPGGGEIFAAADTAAVAVDDEWGAVSEKQVPAGINDFTLSLAEERPGSGFAFKWIATAVGVVVLSAAGGFLLLRSDSGKASLTAQPIAAPTAAAPIPTPIPAQPEVAVQPAADVNNDAPVDLVQPETPATTSDTANAPTAKEPERRTRQAALKPVGPQKKKVTVDDLINDN